MWTLNITSTWRKDLLFYEKKHPRELAAILRNLTRYLNQLNACTNSQSVLAGYLHPEPMGIKAIDQKGGGQGLQETRAYTYADDELHLLYLITIGNKSDQPRDIGLSKDFVATLK